MSSQEFERLSPAQEVTLADLLDRVIEAGVVVAGNAVISVAGIDLIYLDLRLLLASIETLTGEQEAVA